MDSIAADSFIDNVDGPSDTREDLSSNPNYHEDRGETQAACSDNEAVPNPAHLPISTAKRVAKASTVRTIKNADAPNPKRVASIRSKAQRARARFLTLVACVSYLLFHFLGVDLGLRLINGYTEPRLNHADIQLQTALSGVVSERVVRNQLDTLLDTTLERQYQESYRHCLARGLYKADKVFLGFDFTLFADVRNQTVHWIMDNCDRLLYTPQLQTPGTSKLWTMVDNFRRSAEKTVALLKHRVALLRCKIRGIEPRLAAEQPVLHSDRDAIIRSELPTEMPSGFSLDCKELARCQLTYSGPDLSADGIKMLREAPAQASKEIFKWSYPFKRIFYINGYIIFLLSLLQLLLLHFYLLAVHLFHLPPLPQSSSASKASRRARAWLYVRNTITNLSHDEKVALGLVINAALYALLHYELDYITSKFDRLLLPAGLGFCAFHIPQALAFLSPAPEVIETLRSFCQATQELYLILWDAVPASIAKEQPFPAPHAPAASSKTKPASKVGARFISPLTSISEDIQQERKAMHAEQGRQPRDDVEPKYESAMETDSDYDSDVQHASYVDLTGGATLSVTEDVEEWSLVED